jgi:hypothetical protein
MTASKARARFPSDSGWELEIGAASKPKSSRDLTLDHVLRCFQVFVFRV